MATVKLPTIQLEQPIGNFFVGTLPARVLRQLASADMRRITDRTIEEYTGIQRGLSQARLKEIQKYVRTVDASFPNSIILNLRPESIVSQVEIEITGCNEPGRITCFEIEVTERAFQIIDGQHRLAGFDEENSGSFDLIVAFFVDLPLEDQAYLFSTINLTQTKVSKSLVYDLFDVSETRSPQKTAHIIAKALNSERDSPFFQRLRLLGVHPKVDGEILYRAPLTQGTFVRRLVGLISHDPTADRDAERRGKRPTIVGDEVQNGMIFRPFYLEDRDWAILKVLKNYFGAVAIVFREHWDNRDGPLAKTIGYGALMRLLVPMYQQGMADKDVSGEYFEKRFRAIREAFKRSNISMSFDAFPASGAGESKLFEHLLKWSR